ncbi:DUF2497 domain-containing protein [Labrenzia sp. 011]|uniref:PopZ family protein n=1 Tax=Labrenzia sp. 011 TaxID=2171494 RepID=UPI000D520CCE|nr:DUF2497 domain-containing protein [Labrenzia sp. 011]PVB63649.1 DUF2497 domain-containing protein [Labrenzia sp. 011]
MAQAKKAEEPSMEEILASIRRIISDEDSQGADAGAADVSEKIETPVAEEAANDMGDASEMSQDDLDKLFDMDSEVEDVAEDEDLDDMAAAMEADADADGDADGTEDDVLELTEELAVPDEEPLEMVEGLAEDFDSPESDVSFAEPQDFDPEPAPAIASMPIPDDLPPVVDEGPLTSEDTGEAVHAAFDNLTNMFVGSQAQTVEELVKDMLRPMLKAWLDQNLPPMVEQMVQKEIQRVTRRR